MDERNEQDIATLSEQALREDLVAILMRERMQAPSEITLVQHQRGGFDLERPALTVQARPARLPLSYAQERLWVLEQLGLPGGAYTIPGAVRLEGVLDVQALEATFLAIAARHQSLCTRFDSEDGVPYQVIEAPSKLDLEPQDLSELSAAERTAAVAQCARAVAAERFDLQDGPLWLGSVLQRQEEERVVLVSVCHIVSDGWSMGVLIQEISRFYGAYAQGEPASRGSVTVQY